MKFSTIIAAVSLATAAPVSEPKKGDAVAEKVPEYFLIRHAEKDLFGNISNRGKAREQCLVKLFSKDSIYNIQHIMVQTPYDDARSQRPYKTVLPLAQSLNITIDTPCDLDDSDCAGNAARAYSGPGNVLIAWEHTYLPLVAEAIGGGSTEPNGGGEYDKIYNVPVPYYKISITHEDCPDLPWF